MTAINTIRGITFQPPGGHLLPWILIGIVLVAFAVWAYRKNPAPLSARMRTLLWILRGMAFLVLLILICRPMVSLGAGPAGRRGLVLLLDTSESLTLPAASTSGGPSRAATARDLVTRILPALKDKHTVRVYGFDREARPLPDDTKALAASEAARPRGDVTGLGPAIETAVGEMGRTRTGAVVVVSDGVVTAGLDPVAVSHRLALPIYTVGVGSDTVALDAEVARIRVNRTAFLGEEVPIAATVRNQGLTGRTTELSVVDVTRPESPQTVARQALSWAVAGAEQEIRLKFRPREVGLHFFEVRLPEESSEFTRVNNRRLFALDVREEKSRVLLAIGALSWETTFLKRVLDADSSLSVTSMARLGGAWRRLDHPTAPASFVTDPAMLGKYAMVVLMNLDARDLPAAAWEGLAAWTRRGGGLLVFGGAEAGGLRRLAGTAVAPLLPLDPATAAGTGSDNIQAGLTATGRRHPVTQVDESDVANAGLWKDLPPLTSASGPPALRGGGEVLASGGGDASFPVLVTGRAGGGKVLVAPASGYWRWDFRMGPYREKVGFYARLWSNAVRWLTSPDLANRLSVEPGRAVFERGEPIDFTARLADREYQPVDGAEINVTITAADSAAISRSGSAAPRALTLGGSGAGFYAGQTGSLPPGRYRFHAEARARGEALGDVSGVFAVEAMGVEFRRPGADLAFLNRLAAGSGGRAYSAGEARRLPDEITVGGAAGQEVITLDVWDSPWFFAAFVVLLSAEWFIRRRRGMV